jgi:hypothetical protein
MTAAHSFPARSSFSTCIAYNDLTYTPREVEIRTFLTHPPVPARRSYLLLP